MTDGAEALGALDALGDGTRRRLLEVLRSGEKSVAELTDALPVGQSAVSQHLRVLRGAGLVTDRASGTRRYYRITPDGFAAVRAWVDSFWDDALTALGDLAADPPDPAGSPEETS